MAYVKGRWSKFLEERFKITDSAEFIKIEITDKIEFVAEKYIDYKEEYEREASYMNCLNLLYQADYILSKQQLHGLLWHQISDDIDRIFEEKIFTVQKVFKYLETIQKSIEYSEEIYDEIYDICLKYNLRKLEAFIILSNLLNEEIVKYVNNLNNVFNSFLNSERSESMQNRNSVGRTFKFLFNVPKNIVRDKVFREINEPFLYWVKDRKPIRREQFRTWEGDVIVEDIFYDRNIDDLPYNEEGDFLPNEYDRKFKKNRTAL
jgi:hypothetical protein